ncbi:MAG TPA: WYL domain-containing protein [Acidimicrobiales bacterium]|nr:WYL domain-containing protein [Acidimicrobiales bacterium]
MSPQLTVEARLRRLLAVLGWLSRRGAGTARIAEVAARFGMTEAEVVSELELAACCGLPPYSPDQLMELMVDDDEVQADLGPELSRPRRLSSAEGFTLAASARAILAVPGSDPDGALASALAKLEAVLGRRESVSISLDEPGLLEVVRGAADSSAQLRIAYYSASRDEASQRVVDPYHVFSSGGFWYLDAWCHRAEALRHFRVDRIEAAEPTGESFVRPEGGPPATVVAPGPDTQTATVLLPAGAAALLESLPTVSVTPEADGRLRVVLPVGGEAWLARLLLRAGIGSEVLEPPELAGVGARAARSVLAGYR